MVGKDTQCEAETTQKGGGKVNAASSPHQGSVELIRQGGDGLGFICPGRPKEIGCVLAEGGLHVDRERSGFGTGTGDVGQEKDHALADRQSIVEISPAAAGAIASQLDRGRRASLNRQDRARNRSRPWGRLALSEVKSSSSSTRRAPKFSATLLLKPYRSSRCSSNQFFTWIATIVISSSNSSAEPRADQRDNSASSRSAN